MRRYACASSGNYPWQEQVKIVIDSSSPVNHTLALRLPDWCDKPQVTLNGAPVTQDVRKGYLPHQPSLAGRATRYS
ncbi:Uncharacterized protein conserved in bacteria [Klebsiella michiganensis]|nr:Uncharacterized protein conserved in bacteria [Klebsiella michiganensis]